MSGEYVQPDQHGVWRVASTHVMLDSIVAAFAEGHTAEAIQTQYPSLTLEQIYGAIAYYLGHRDEVHAYLNQQDATWARWRQQAENDGASVIRRLRNHRKPSGAEIA